MDLDWLKDFLALAGDEPASGRLVRAGAQTFDIRIDIGLFRSPDCRKHSADRLWASLNSDSGLGT